MKWKRTLGEEPEGGDRRTRKVFALWPTPVRDYNVLFEYYFIEEVYFQPAGGGPGWWSEVSRDIILPSKGK